MNFRSNLQSRQSVIYIIVFQVAILIPSHFFGPWQELAMAQKRDSSSVDELVLNLPDVPGMYFWTDDIAKLSADFRQTSLFDAKKFETVWRAASRYNDDLTDEEADIEDAEYAQAKRLLLIDRADLFSGIAIFARIKPKAETTECFFFLAQTQAAPKEIELFIRDIVCLGYPGAEGERLRGQAFERLPQPFAWKVQNGWFCCGSYENIVQTYLDVVARTQIPEARLSSEGSYKQALVNVQAHGKGISRCSFLITGDSLPFAMPALFRTQEIGLLQFDWPDIWEMLTLDTLQGCAGRVYMHDKNQADGSQLEVTLDCFIPTDRSIGGLESLVGNTSELKIDIPVRNNSIRRFSQLRFNGAKIAEYLDDTLESHPSNEKMDHATKTMQRIRSNELLFDFLTHSYGQTSFLLTATIEERDVFFPYTAIECLDHELADEFLIQLANAFHEQGIFREVKTEHRWNLVSPKQDVSIVRYTDLARAEMQIITEKASEERVSRFRSMPEAELRKNDLIPDDVSVDEWIESRAEIVRRAYESMMSREFLRIADRVYTEAFSPDRIQELLSRDEVGERGPTDRIKANVAKLKSLAKFKHEPFALKFQSGDLLWQQLYSTYALPRLTSDFWQFYRVGKEYEVLIRAARNEPKWYDEMINLTRHWDIGQYLHEQSGGMLVMIENAEQGFHISGAILPNFNDTTE